MSMRSVFVPLVAACCLMAGGATPSGQPPTARVMSLSTFANLFVVIGGGTNSIAVGADDGVILVDSKVAGWGKTIVEKVELGTEGPITTIINVSATTAGSTPEITTAREIIAHENTRTHLATMGPFTGAGAKFLPGRTFKDTLSLPVKTKGDKEGTNRIDLHYLGPARTNGDVIAVFPSFEMAFLGEVFPAKAVPAIDRRYGGSALALPDTVAKAHALLQKAGVKLVVPGRAAPPPTPYVMYWMTQKDVQEYAEFTRDILAAVVASAQAGQSVDMAVAAFTVPEKYKQYTAEHAKEYVQAVYDELGKK